MKNKYIQLEFDNLLLETALRNFRFAVIESINYSELNEVWKNIYSYQLDPFESQG